MVDRVAPPLPSYAPASPSDRVRRLAIFRQALRLPITVRAIYRIVREDYHAAALDEYLWSFRGFHQTPEDPHCRARRWQKVTLARVGPSDVAGLPVWELAFMMSVAMEIEEPILDYSRENGEGFRLLLPPLARFMGKNREEAAYAAAHDLPWCESPWCAEERRHANTFARMIERLTAASPSRQNPNRPMIAAPSEDEAARLLLSREAAEWNSSSTYVVMAAHATGGLHHLIRNIARDEIKHLSILGAAALYLFGPRPWRRFADLVRQSLNEFRGHKRARSSGDLLGTNPVTAFEVIVAHFLTERYVRKWLRSLPLTTLTWIFESNPDGKEKRESLIRWHPDARLKALAQRAFEQTHAAAIDATIASELDNFASAEPPGSRIETNLRRKIRNLGGRMLRTSLLHRLRDHQIRNNRHVLTSRASETGSRLA